MNNRCAARKENVRTRLGIVNKRRRRLETEIIARPGVTKSGEWHEKISLRIDGRFRPGIGRVAFPENEIAITESDVTKVAIGRVLNGVHALRRLENAIRKRRQVSQSLRRRKNDATAQSVNARAGEGGFGIGHCARAQRTRGDGGPVLEVAAGFQNHRRGGKARTGNLGLIVGDAFYFGDAKILAVGRKSAKSRQNRDDKRTVELIDCHFHQGALRDQCRIFPDYFNRFGLVFYPYFFLVCAKKNARAGLDNIDDGVGFWVRNFAKND